MENIDLSEFFRTKAQAADFSVRLARVIDAIYQNGFTIEKTLQEQFGMQKKEKFLALLREHGLTDASNESLKAFLSKLQTITMNTPVLSLTLAFEPKEETLRVLTEWFAMNLKKQVIFDIVVDERLIAGVAINYKGKHGDFSIRQTFESVYQEMTTGKKTPPQTAAAKAAPQTQAPPPQPVSAPPAPSQPAQHIAQQAPVPH